MSTTEEEKNKGEEKSTAKQSSKEPLLFALKKKEALLEALFKKEAEKLSALVLHDNGKKLEETEGRDGSQP